MTPAIAFAAATGVVPFVVVLLGIMERAPRRTPIDPNFLVMGWISVVALRLGVAVLAACMVATRRG